MNRVLNVLCEQLADIRGATDGHLLDRFLTGRDEAAFAELVRRYGPVVWGACRRRLARLQDAEDAFQATFLVLMRRADRLHADAPLGPWLYRVAVMTARNVARSNRRRAAISGPMEHEVPALAGDSEAKLDLDAVLLALSERDRAAVVLCHLQGLSRREAAERLGCPEGTLSARLSRALSRLRSRLGGGAPAVLAGAAVAVPTGLASATVRSAAVYSTSTLTVAGVSPVVVALTDGVLRMFWMKKVTTAAVVAVLFLGAGVLALGTATRTDNAARATEPLDGAAPPANAEETDPLKRLEKRLTDLEKQKELLDRTLEDIRAEKRKLEDAHREKEAEAEAKSLGKDIEVSIGANDWPRPYLVREVVNGRVSEMTCSSLDLLTTYLARAKIDPKGPKNLRITAYKDHSMDDLRKVFAACAAAGYVKATFSQITRPLSKYKTAMLAEYDTIVWAYAKKQLDAQPKPGEIDLKKFADPKKP